MAKAKQLPSGAWRIRVYTGTDINGIKKYISITKDTKKEAEYMALEIQTGKNNNNMHTTNMTLSDTMLKYINIKAAVLSPSTISGYHRIHKNYFSSLANIKLSKITSEMIQLSINELSMKHSPKTVRNIHGLLSAVYKEYNPNFILNTTLPQKQKYIPTTPTMQDIQNIVKIVKGSDIELPVFLALWLGMRMSEIRAITWNDIVDSNLHIRNAMVYVDRKNIIKATKSFSGTRTVNIPPHILNMINAQNKDTQFVINMSGQSIYKKFVKLLKDNNLPHFRFHDLRHANASIMLMLGIPDKYAMERLGHSTTNMLKTVYQHTISEEKEIINNKIDNYFKGILE